MTDESCLSLVARYASQYRIAYSVTCAPFFSKKFHQVSGAGVDGSDDSAKITPLQMATGAYRRMGDFTWALYPPLDMWYTTFCSDFAGASVFFVIE